MIAWLLLAAGRRSKFAVLVVVLSLGAGLASQAGNLAGVQRNDTAAFLPGSSDSVRSLHALAQFPSGDRTSAVVVFGRAGALTAADRARISRIHHALDRARVPLGLPVPAARFARRGDAAALVVPLRTSGDQQLADRSIDRLRARVGVGVHGLEIRVTGAAAFQRDADAQVAGIDGTLLLAAGALVLLLLIAIYRSPIFWVVPFFCVVLAVGAAQGLAYLLARAGLNVNAESAGILSVLVFGVGTDYALLLVARYREELMRHPGTHGAMRAALAQGGPAILAAGLTVVCALLTLTVARVDSSASLGPIGAAGVFTALLISLTLLPAVLILAGRRAFWPRIPRVGDDPDATGQRWERLGERLARRPRRAWLRGLIVLAACAAGALNLDTDLSPTGQFRTPSEAVIGQQLLARSFPAGLSAPVDIVVKASRSKAVIAALNAHPDLVAAISPVERGPHDQIHLAGELTRDPFASGAPAFIPRIRSVVATVAPRALVGGLSAQQYDLQQAADHDSLLIPPFALAVVFLILVVLLRALLAAVLLIAGVLAGYAATLGLSTLAFAHLFGFPAADPTFALLTFVFLVALGTDYTIFLAARIRDEARHHAIDDAVTRGLSATGPVITSAGLVLAGTFAALALVPLAVLTQIGFAVALGVLVDTLLIRSVIVPALILDTGPRFWWPSPIRGRTPE